jgi:hypothetical protein
MLKQTCLIALALITLASCRDYDLESRLTSQRGLIPPDQFARYGREQAEEMAVAREYGAALDHQSAADTAVRFARSVPDVADVQVDSPGYRVTLRFKSGWRTMVTPIEDGKRARETTRAPGSATPKTTR